MNQLLSQLRSAPARGRALHLPHASDVAGSQPRARHDKALLYLSRCALRAAKPESVLAEICRITARVLRVDHVHVLELLPDGRTLIARAAAGWSPEQLTFWHIDAAPASRLAQAMRHRTLILLDDSAEHPPGGAMSLLQAVQMRAGLAKGVTAAAEAYGLFGVYSLEARRFTRDELQFVRAAGDLVESTLERGSHLSEERAARATFKGEQADLLRLVVGRLRPALRQGAVNLLRLRGAATDTFTVRRAVRQSEQHVIAVGDFLEDVSLLAELLEGRRPPVSAVPLAPLLMSIVEQLSERAEANKIDLQLRMPDQLAATRGDAALLRRALFNIAENALRFTAPHGSVLVRVHAGDTATTIEFIDSGRGMTAAQIAALARSGEGSATSEHSGVGLGWRLAAAIVETHGGTITPSSPGRDHGSTVCIALPRLHPGDGDVPGFGDE